MHKLHIFKPELILAVGFAINYFDLKSGRKSDAQCKKHLQLYSLINLILLLLLREISAQLNAPVFTSCSVIVQVVDRNYFSHLLGCLKKDFCGSTNQRSLCFMKQKQ